MKGIWIPQELIDADISWIKKALLCEISQLEILEKGCIASNNHFSNKFNITNQGISKALNELSKDGYITINNAQTKRNFGRKITINFSKSPINFSKSDIHESGESKEKKPTKKPINIFDAFLKELKSKVTIKSKVTKTKDGEELFKLIENKKKLMNDYIKHQLEKKEFAQRITAYMMDYETLHKKEDKPKNILCDEWGNEL